MKKHNRILLLLLAAVLVSIQTSCKNTETQETSQDSDTSSETIPVETLSSWERLESVDYEGYKFNILTFERMELDKWLCMEEQTGELFNDGIFFRNTAIMELYNISIASDNPSSPDNAFNSMVNEVMASSGAYDISYQWAMKMIGAATNGILYNILEMPELHLQDSWWNSHSIDEFTLLPGKLYYAANAINCYGIDFAAPLFFNRNLVEDYSLESPYDLVRNGNWTLDECYGMMEAVASSMDGTETRSENDIYGVTTGWGQTMAVYQGCGLTLAKRTSDENIPSLTVSFQNEQELKVADWLNKVLNNKTLTADMNDDSWAVEAFYLGNALFYMQGMGKVTDLRDNMDDNFGIVPSPKLDNSQEKYYVSAGGRNLPLLCFPADQKNITRTAVITEALAIYSQEFLTDVYIDDLLSGKYARDEDTKEMVKLIIDNIFYDFSNLTISKLFDSWHPAVKKGGSETLTSTAQSIQEAVKNEYAEYMTAISSLE